MMESDDVIVITTRHLVLYRWWLSSHHAPEIETPFGQKVRFVIEKSRWWAESDGWKYEPLPDRVTGDVNAFDRLMVELKLLAPPDW